MALLSEEKRQEGREWLLTVAADRAERATALKLAKALTAAGEHLKSLASGLAAEFGLVKWQAATGPIDEALVDVMLNGLGCDFPINWRDEFVGNAPSIPDDVDAQLNIDSDTIRDAADRVRQRVQGAVKNLAGIGEDAGDAA